MSRGIAGLSPLLLIVLATLTVACDSTPSREELQLRAVTDKMFQGTDPAWVESQKNLLHCTEQERAAIDRGEATIGMRLEVATLAVHAGENNGTGPWVQSKTVDERGTLEIVYWKRIRGGQYVLYLRDGIVEKIREQ